MSGYRSYVPWNKNSSSSSSQSYSSNSKKETNPTPTPKYESPYSKSRPDAKKTEDKPSATTTIGSKYSGAYSSGYQRDTSTPRTTDSSRTELTTRIKSPIDKKESHPPVTYRPLIRTTSSRSRDPSPVDKDKTDSTFSYNRLYPRSYTRSASRERTDSTSSSTTIPKYTGRTSLTKEDYNKYPLGRTSRQSSREDLSLAKYKPPETKEDLLTARFKSKEDLTAKYKIKDTNLLTPRYKSAAASKEDLSRYKPPSTTSKEDLSRYKPTSTSTKDDLSRYKPPSTSTKDDLSRYKPPSTTSKEDLSRYKPTSSTSKEDVSRYKTKEESRYKPTSRTTSREDLTAKTPQKYITSRFLPKNSIEKSHTAYLRPSTRTREVSIKNRELLNVLSSQHDDRSSRPVSRASSIAPEDIKDYHKIDPKVEEVQEMETISVVTRSTSPNPPNAQNTYVRSRRIEMARLVEKQISRPKKRGEMVDKEIQSDRLDDTTKNSRFAGASRISATPWSSYLDLKYSSPGEGKKENDSSQSEQIEYHSVPQSSEKSLKGKESVSNSPKSISRNNSAKSLSQSSSKSDLRSRELKSRSNSSISLKSKISPPKIETKKLPPQIPKAESPSKVPTLHSLNTPNKDFRKSVLNMNTDGKLKKLSKRSNSVSSAESESSICGNSEATEVSENLSSCKSYHKSNSSLTKLPQRVQDENRDRRSPSCTSDSSSSSSSTEDETRVKSNKSNTASSMLISSADELSLDKSPKPPLSPRVRLEKENEAKSFLRRALAPVTNFFKAKQDSSEKSNWLESSPDVTDKSISDLPKTTSSSETSSRKLIRKIESGDRSWWMEESEEQSLPKGKVKLLRHVESGERAWWLDGAAEVPEGIEVYPATSTGEDGRTEDGKLVYKIRKNDSGAKAWWLDESDKSKSESEKKKSEGEEPEFLQKYNIRHIDSGERAWWMSSSENLAENKNEEKNFKVSKADSGERAWWLQSSKSEDEFDPEVPLGDRASPEGLETPRDEDEGRLSPYDNVPQKANKGNPALFISKHTNIDDILGGSSQLLSPLMDRIFSYQTPDCEVIDATQVRIHDSTPQRGIIQPARLDTIGACQKNYNKLDDAALQLYKDGDYGSYLDLDASISEQQEEFEGFQTNKKNSIVLRTQLSVRVHTIIEKLLTSEGRELRRALFSLKQIFQEDKDLVHEFVQNDGLACLIKVGSVADQNYQNYILRALGQVMLYVDGMNGVMEHNQTVQWLYTLISSKFRLVVKTALKLLLVFVEYTDSNCKLLIKAIHAVDCSQGLLPWHNIMKLLKDFDSADTELLIYATTLINKCLNGVPDQDTYYDQTDALEEHGIENIIQRYMSKPGTDLDLLQQFQIYEAVLQYEDGEEKGTPIRHLDESIRKTLMSRKSLIDSADRRKSRRHSSCTTPVHSSLNNNNVNSPALQVNNEDDDESSSSQSSNGHNHQSLNGSYKDSNKVNDAGVTPALRRRRERAERQRSFMKEQQENATLLRGVITNSDDVNENGNYTNGLQQRLSNGNNVLIRNSSRKDLTPYLNAVNKLDSEENGLTKQPWIMYKDDQNQENVEDAENANENDRKMLIQLKKENTVKDLTQKLASQNILHSPSSEDNKINRMEGMTGLISKAKEGLAKSKSQANVVKSPTGDNIPKVIEVKKSENELRWEELVSSMSRPLNLCDMDFTDLESEDEADVLAPVAVSNGIPPPPPPLEVGVAPPPPPRAGIPPPVPSPPVFGVNLQRLSKPTETKIPIKKNKKTVKLFWKEVREDPMNSVKLKTGYIWDELNPVTVDTQKLEHLFESRAKDLINKKQQELNKNKEIIVLDPKRSNAINIGMTKLPPPRSIKTAILKMDATIMNREGIEKLLTMLPTEEERSKIQEAQAANPDLPLGSAEQFLLTLASISELPARLKLWAFKLDFENTEREIAEPLMDLKQGFEVLKVNKTFRGILSTLLSIGNFLNGNEVKGFQIEYLSKVPEVKDTVHKHSLLHHLCHIVMEKFPDATDLYSEIGAITRASKVDFDELGLNIQRLEAECKASWDHLKLIAKHDGSTMKSKMMDFLADCAERIILLGIIYRRVMNRFHKFLLWLGIPIHQISDTKPNDFCRIVSEFALEYRTTRERVLQQLEKKANHRERNKTRGKMITETAKFRTKEDRADAELRQLLGSDISDVESLQGTLPWRRTKKDANRSLMGTINGHLPDGDDEILESLVKTATKAPSSRTAPRERKRTRHADRKSLRRTLKNGLSEEEKKHLSMCLY